MATCEKCGLYKLEDCEPYCKDREGHYHCRCHPNRVEVKSGFNKRSAGH